jgi:hypothetical protein
MSESEQIAMAIKNSLYTHGCETGKIPHDKTNDLYGDWVVVNRPRKNTQPVLKSGGRSFFRENHEGKHDDDSD